MSSEKKNRREVTGERWLFSGKLVYYPLIMRKMQTLGRASPQNDWCKCLATTVLELSSSKSAVDASYLHFGPVLSFQCIGIPLVLLDQRTKAGLCEFMFMFDFKWLPSRSRQGKFCKHKPKTEKIVQEAAPRVRIMLVLFFSRNVNMTVQYRTLFRRCIQAQWRDQTKQLQKLHMTAYASKSVRNMFDVTNVLTE